MKKIPTPEIGNIFTGEAICPECGQPLVLKAEYGIGYCSSQICNTFFEFTSQISFSSLGRYADVYEPMLEEAQKHFDDRFMKMEMDAFHLDEETLKANRVGCYPVNYWVKKLEEWKFGKLILPMKSWSGETVNIWAKDIGADDKLDLNTAIRLAKKKPVGVFNPRGFWNEEVYVYLNPTDALAALQAGQDNAIGVWCEIVLPEVIPTELVHVIGFKGGEAMAEAIRDMFSAAGVKAA